MKKLKRYLNHTMLLLALSMMIFSCSKDEPETPATTTTTPIPTSEAKTSITSSGDEAASDLGDIADAEGTQAGVNMTRLMQKDTVFASRVAGKIGQSFVNLAYSMPGVTKSPSARLASNDSSEFVFADHVGTYSWNHSTQKWVTDKNNPSDRIVFNFPSDSVGTANNCILTVNAFTFVTITKDSTTDHMPSNVNGNLLVNSVEVASVAFTATYDNGGMPKTLDLNLKLKPFRLVVTFADNGSSVTADAALTKDGVSGNIMAVGGTFVFTDATKEKPKNFNNVYVQHRKLKLVGAGDFQAFEADTTSDDYLRINTHFSVEIFHNDRKAGKLVIEKNADPAIEEPDVMIEFNDGTKDKAEPYVKKMLDRLEREINNIKI